MKIKLETLLLLIANAEMEIVIVENHSNKQLCEGNCIVLLMFNGGRAQMYFNREVRCITTEKWRGVYYPNHQIIIVVEEWEIED